VTAAARQLPVRLLIEPTTGKNRALNRALPEARGDLLVFTDDDVIPDPDWLVALTQGAARWPQAAVFGGRILPRWPTGLAPFFDHPFFRHAYAIADWQTEEGYYSAGRVFGANMAVRSAIVAGGWRFAPEVGPQGGESYIPGSETELTGRLEKAGLRSVYLPDALVFHCIRPEQLQLPWLYGRAFRRGRFEGQNLPAISGLRIAGAPLVVWAKLARALLVFLGSRYCSDPAVRFEHAVLYWRHRGIIHELRRRRGGRATGHFRMGPKGTRAA
jgi:glucosyl-dolichyl phosphate glucuronosyltransferase